MFRHRFVWIVCFVLTIGFSGKSIRAQEAVEESSTKPPPAKHDASAISESKAKKLAGHSIQEVMTPDEFKAAGLDKLTEDELQHLDAWLQGYRQTAEKRVSEQAEKKATEEIKKATEQAKARAPKLMVDKVVSRIDGNFTGLTGRTVM